MPLLRSHLLSSELLRFVDVLFLTLGDRRWDEDGIGRCRHDGFRMGLPSSSTLLLLRMPVGAFLLSIGLIRISRLLFGILAIAHFCLVLTGLLVALVRCRFGHFLLFLALAVHFVVEHRLWDEIEQQPVGNPAAVEAEAVGPWIHLARRRTDRPIIRSRRIRNPRAKHLGKEAGIGRANSAFTVDIELCLGHFLLKFDWLSFVILDRDFVCLIAAAPEDKVSRA